MEELVQNRNAECRGQVDSIFTISTTVMRRPPSLDSHRFVHPMPFPNLDLRRFRLVFVGTLGKQPPPFHTTAQNDQLPVLLRSTLSEGLFIDHSSFDSLKNNRLGSSVRLIISVAG